MLWENPPNFFGFPRLVVTMKRTSAVRTFHLAALSAVALLGLSSLTASAQAADPYTPGTTGYDVSYPNCGATPAGAFGIVGVNGGRAFTTNSCFASEYAAAAGTGSASAYINTGYSGAYRRNITPTCSSLVSSTGLTGTYAQAWEIGCSEADTSLSDVGGATPAMWWLDVETGNSWSSSNRVLNQDAIQGAVSRLVRVNPNVGVYSDASFWKTITGGNSWTPSGLAADWTAAGGCAAAFTSSPVWLAQQGSANGVDSDLAC